MQLVLTTDESGAGHLKSIRRGKKVLAVTHRLVRDPAPATKTIHEFFAERNRLHLVEPIQFGSWPHSDESMTAQWFNELQKSSSDLDFVEFWADPDPNSQLILIQFLDWVGRQGFPVEKLRLIHADTPLGERTSCDPRSNNPIVVQVDARHLDIAHMAWTAFCQTPEGWVSLLHDDLDALPFLRATVLLMLKELPEENSALGASESRILVLASGSGIKTEDIIRIFFDPSNEIPILQYWEVGKAIDLLAQTAAITGLVGGPFDESLHKSKDRFGRYMHSWISLTHFGAALLEGREDFAQRGRICRWWGGTKLTNDNCWRWSDTRQVLLKPTETA